MDNIFFMCSLIVQAAASPATQPPLPVTIIIPALNEERVISRTLASLRALDPPPAQILVSVGPSTDATARLARAAGATVIAGAKGRAVQMDDAAAAAAKASSKAPAGGGALVFVHADTTVPADLVALVRGALADEVCVGGGFVSIIASAQRTFWGMSLHNVAKTFYLPLIFRPWAYPSGLRVLFGDQVIFCRAADYRAAGGFNRSLPIMEAGRPAPPTAAALPGEGPWGAPLSAHFWPCCATGP